MTDKKKTAPITLIFQALLPTDGWEHARHAIGFTRLVSNIGSQTQKIK